MSTEQLLMVSHFRIRKPYNKFNYWKNRERLQKLFGVDTSYHQEVNRDVLDAMKQANEAAYYEVLCNQLTFEYYENFQSQVYGLLTEEERERCIPFCSYAPVHLISSASLGCGSEIAFSVEHRLDSLNSTEETEQEDVIHKIPYRRKERGTTYII